MLWAEKRIQGTFGNFWCYHWLENFVFSSTFNEWQNRSSILGVWNFTIYFAIIWYIIFIYLNIHHYYELPTGRKKLRNLSLNRRNMAFTITFREQSTKYLMMTLIYSRKPQSIIGGVWQTSSVIFARPVHTLRNVISRYYR